MGWVVQTTTGTTVLKEIDSSRPLPQGAAEADAKARNARAVEMELEVRYEAVER